MLLKLYTYGYLNSVSSIRRLEKECKLNLEVIWLTGYLCPDHKIISDFRKENGDGIQLAFKQLGKLLESNGYIKGHTTSIDGSKIRANASMSIGLESIEKRLQNLDIQINDYLSRLNDMDNYDDELEEKRQAKEKLDQEIEQLRQQVEELRDKKKPPLARFCKA